MDDAERGPAHRDAAGTRDALLKAARRRFSRGSYDAVSLREIAGDVGVNAALVKRYFGSKPALFAEILKTCGDAAWLDGGRADFGDRLAHDLVYGSDADDRISPLILMLQSIGSRTAGPIVRDTIAEVFSDPLTAWLGGDDAEARAFAVATILIGATLQRTLTWDATTDVDTRARTQRRLARLLQACVD